MAVYYVNVLGPSCTFAQNSTGLGTYLMDEIGEGYFCPFLGVVATDLAGPGDVREGVTNGPYTGNMTEPDEADVRSGVQFGANGTEFEGTLDGGGGNHSFVG